MSATVTTSLAGATLTGTREQGICCYRHLPYAQAPVGELRLRPPRPLTLAGAIDATQAGPVAPQLPSRLREVMGDFEASQSEDCLHLTVWTPGADANRRPVVIWMHGGAWQSGGGAIDWYDGARLAREGDVVVVGINYRLAALGWLYLPGVAANLGLLDMELAIEWVRRHIAALGGDPERITVMGQSAGGFNTALLLTREPQFTRAILQSASIGRGCRSAAQALALTEVFMDAVGARDLDDLQALPCQALLQAQQAPAVLQALKDEGGARSLFCPVADGDVLPLDVDARLPEASGRADVLIGYTHDEMAAFPGGGTDEASHALGMRIFGTPAHQWAQSAQEHGRQAWLYRMDLGPTDRYGACHCIELPFVFGTLETFAGAPMLHGMDPAHGAGLSDAMRRDWIAFIRGGAPYPEPAPALHRYA
ncbi:MAG TPA: carboxylesterase family protein [Bordetella sp.]